MAHPPRPAPTVLVLALPGPEGDDLFAELSARPDLVLLRVATASSASVALEDVPVSLVVVGPETAPAEIERVLGHRDRTRPGVPVLALRARQAGIPEGWKDRGVAVLRLPLLPGALPRSLDLVLGMKGAR